MNPQAIRPSRRALWQRKRRAILNAALRAFDAGGFQATSMDQVAARANVSKRTIYNHFASKEELLEAIRGELFGEIARIEFEYQPLTPLAEQLRAIATDQVESLCSEVFVTFARISIPLGLRSADVAKTTYREFHASQRAILKWIKAAMEDGRIAVDDPAFATRQFVGLLNAGVFWPQLVGGQSAPSKAARKRIVNSTVSMFLNEYAVKQ
jgi:TetR/AcrR family transcriptional regulator of autoinduction and epiphytic fitness